MGTIDEMVGASPAICAVFDLVRKMATTEMPVLITGETGTGKELTAQAIHERSLRKLGPFVPINCGAIPETLLESELFGHERGAFTGAVQQKKGKLEAAAGGTLFLDEVGDLLPALQVKLLRFLQEGTFERVGGQETLHVDARVLAATNVDLKTAIERTSFGRISIIGSACCIFICHRCGTGAKTPYSWQWSFSSKPRATLSQDDPRLYAAGRRRAACLFVARKCAGAQQSSPTRRGHGGRDRDYSA